MNFSLNIICRNELTEEKESEVQALLSALGIAEKAQFEPYWKDASLSQTIFGAELKNPDFNLMEARLSKIAGAEVALSTSIDEWEFSHYASAEELACGKSSAFVVCQVF